MTMVLTQTSFVASFSRRHPWGERAEDVGVRVLLGHGKTGRDLFSDFKIVRYVQDIKLTTAAICQCIVWSLS